MNASELEEDDGIDPDDLVFVEDDPPPPPEAVRLIERATTLFADGDPGELTTEDRLLIEWQRRAQAYVDKKLDEDEQASWLVNLLREKQWPGHVYNEVWFHLVKHLVVKPQPKVQAPWTAEQARVYEQLILDTASAPVEDVRGYLAQKATNPMYVAFKKAHRPQRRKYVRGVPYQGPPKDRSDEPYYTNTPTGVHAAVLAGRLQPFDETIATLIYSHNRRTYRAKDRGRRISAADLSVQSGKYVRTVQRSLARLLNSGEMEIESSGKHNRNGTIYGFPSRSEEQGRDVSRDVSSHSTSRARRITETYHPTRIHGQDVSDTSSATYQ